MSKSAPEWGADTDLFHRTNPGLGMPTAVARCLHRDGLDETLGDRGCVATVRVGLSYADDIETFPVDKGGNTVVTPFSAALTQSERGLDLAESPPKGGGEARASGIRRPEGAERAAVRWRLRCGGRRCTISCIHGRVTPVSSKTASRSVERVI